MKLQSVKFENSEQWYTLEYLPDNPREVLIHTKEFGTTSGYYKSDTNSWFLFRWQCFISNPICWRELPRYENQNSL